MSDHFERLRAPLSDFLLLKTLERGRGEAERGRISRGSFDALDAYSGLTEIARDAERSRDVESRSDSQARQSA